MNDEKLLENKCINEIVLDTSTLKLLENQQQLVEKIKDPKKRFLSLIKPLPNENNYNTKYNKY